MDTLCPGIRQTVEDFEPYQDAAHAAIRAYEAARGDVVVVPREPTPAILSAMESAASQGIGKPADDEAIPHVYRAMIAAAKGESGSA